MYSKKNVLGKHLIAVYGTLKKDYNNYYNYLTQSKYVGPGMTMEKYPLLIEGLPFLLNKPGVGHYVDVDLFLVDDATLEMIDGLEGHPDWYYREKIEVDTKDGTVVTASVYFNHREDSGIHHKTYTQEYKPLSTFDEWNENYQEEYECDCDSPQKVWDEWDNEFYCLDCMCTIKETI
jgi:gamma-glutamylaminecyclotransferase